jgi:RHS repeat-associated protein
MPLSLSRRPQSAYDAEGRRVGKGAAANLTCSAPPANGFTLTNQYLLGRTGEQVTELNGAAALLHSNAYLGSRLLATYDFVNSGLHFALTDPLGTKRVQLSGQGVPELNCLSLPFGNDLGNPRATDCVPAPNATAPAADAAEPHFTGKERDTETGLDYFGARYYASNMGRWMSPDWADKPEAVPYSDLGDPQSLNLYGYVRNNPLNHTDPDGHVIGVDDVGAAVSAAVVIGGLATYYYLSQPSTQRSLSAATSSAVSTVVGWFHSKSQDSSTVPAPQSNPAPGTQAGNPHAPGDVPDGQTVVRGGQGAIPTSGTYSGAQGANVEEAGKGVPHGTVSPTTAGEIRAAGGDVRPAPEPAYPGGPVNGQHVNINGGQSAFGPQQPNPAPKPERVPSAPKPNGQ